MTRIMFSDISEAVIRPITETELALFTMKRGKKVVQHSGRYWVETARGFFEPVHWLARVPKEQINRPSHYCWGYRSCLHKEEAAYANGSLPIHLLDENDLTHYEEANLPAKRRSQLRKSRKVVQVVRIVEPEPYLEQGYDVLKSAVNRTHHGSIPAFDRYCENMQRQFAEDKSILLAALVDGQMRGYVVLSAVDDVAYIDTVLLATEFLSTDMGTALAFESVQVARRCPQIKHVVYGLHSVEDSRLGVFKEGMGFKIHLWPLKFRIPQIIRWIVGRQSPEKLYRLMGGQFKQRTVLATPPLVDDKNQ